MKLSDRLEHLLHPQPEKRELLFSLVLDSRGVLGEVWSIQPDGQLKSLAYASQLLNTDNWEERLQGADRVIVALEEKAGTREIVKVVLGMPVGYLSPSGEIAKNLKPEIKKLTQELSLKPVGFVTLPQALIHQLKKHEGVPPSAILLGISAKLMTVSLYKVGALSGQATISESDDPVKQFEKVLRGFTDVEVLPSRILLYGLEEESLGTLRALLLRYPWTTRANFLHFPKIEIITLSGLIGAVSLAGAGELALAVKVEEEEGIAPVSQPEARSEVPRAETQNEREVTGGLEEETTPAGSGQTVADKLEIVDPEQLGFKANVDILEELGRPAKPPLVKTPLKKQVLVEPPKEEVKAKLVFPGFSFPKLPKLAFRFPQTQFAGRVSPLLAAALGIILVLGYLVYYFVPRATVTILEIPKTVSYTTSVTIDPGAAAIDPAEKVLPGKQQEKVVTGNKTIPVTGKKKVGDPAKGSVVIYNKVTSSKLLRKGAVLTASQLAFTLDSDVTIASASETIGSITFGKATGNLTASVIGAESNLPANTEFLFKELSANIAVARNEQPFTGGTSREVTVVSRADYDNLVKLVSEELVTKAKQDLAGEISGGEKLLDATVKTTVTEKTFTQELDQESQTLDGKITVNVSGISYNETQLIELLKNLFAGEIPAGYQLEEPRNELTTSSVSVKKDGKISLKVQFKGVALPQLDLVGIRQQLAGKKISQAQEYLRTIQGVAGAEFHFRYDPWQKRLPLNRGNISIGVEIQE